MRRRRNSIPTTSKKSKSPSSAVRKLLLVLFLAISGIVLSFFVFLDEVNHSPYHDTGESVDHWFLHVLEMNAREQSTTAVEKTGVSAPVSVDTNTSSARTTVNKTALCFPYNSYNWLHSTSRRLDNFHDPLLHEDFAMDMILQSPPLLSHQGGGHFHTILKQSLCHDNSKFLDVDMVGADRNQTLHFWALRLIYLAVHVHQHESAILEAQARHAHKAICMEQLSQHQIGLYDYECPDTKFLVVSMGRLGLGAVMRLGAVNALIAAMATNRTLLFVNNAQVGPDFLRDPWFHASCPRRDVQCFYLPTSPCTILEDELANAHVLTRGEGRRVFRFGEIPPEHVNDRVIILNQILRPQRVPETLRPNLRRIANQLIDPLEALGDDRVELLREAADLILQEDPLVVPGRNYTYFGSTSKINHALVFYAMRPNLYYHQKMDKMIQSVLPDQFDPEASLGLPIRASDKCLMESECLPFATYMKLMQETWTLHQSKQPARADIVLTTESESVLREKDEYEQNRTTTNFDYRFVTNSHDVAQGTGLPRNFEARIGENVTADDIMLSAVSSLQLQLYAKYTVGNCCSNFHLLLFDFLRDGCGAADNENLCLQEHENPEYRVCCMWTDSQECKDKAKLREEKQKQREEAKKANKRQN